MKEESTYPACTPQGCYRRAYKLVATLSFAALVASACSSSLGSYRCESNSDCVLEGESGGICEANEFCSFVDTECPEGQRYGKGSAELSGECVRSADIDAGSVVRFDAQIADAAAQSTPDAQAVPCVPAILTLTQPGTTVHSMPDGCSTLTISAYGAGGGGADRSLSADSGSGGGGASGLQIGTSISTPPLLVAGGGGGGGTDDAIEPAPGLGGGGGGGGYATAVFTLSPGTVLNIAVGGGGKTNDDVEAQVGGDGGAPGGGAGGDGIGDDGSPPTTPWGGGGGGGDDASGGSSIYGGGGGSEEDFSGGDSTYGGAGAAAQSVPSCGVSQFGGACDGVAGGGGGFFIAATATQSMGELGNPGSVESGGGAGMSGPGEGGDGGTNAVDGNDGMVVLSFSE